MWLHSERRNSLTYSYIGTGSRPYPPGWHNTTSNSPVQSTAILTIYSTGFFALKRTATKHKTGLSTTGTPGANSTETTRTATTATICTSSSIPDWAGTNLSDYTNASRAFSRDSSSH